MARDPRRAAGRERVRGEADVRPRRRQPDQRRRLRARARDPRPRPAAATCRSSARYGRCSSETGCTAFRATATGWTSHPDRYLQGTFDIIEGNVRSACASASDPTARRGRSAIVQAGRSLRRHRAAQHRRGGLAVGSLWSSARMYRSHGHRRGALGAARRGARRQGCELRDCIIAPAARSARTPRSARSDAGRGCHGRGGNVITAGRVSSRVNLPDGAMSSRTAPPNGPVPRRPNNPRPPETGTQETTR